VEPLRAEVAVLGHDLVPELLRIGDVALEEADALPPSPDRGEVTGVEVLRAAAKVAVAGEAAARREDRGSGEGMGIVVEALGPGPTRDFGCDGVRRGRPRALVVAAGSEDRDRDEEDVTRASRG
jgi:hypothetical protein